MNAFLDHNKEFVVDKKLPLKTKLELMNFWRLNSRKDDLTGVTKINLEVPNRNWSPNNYT